MKTLSLDSLLSNGLVCVLLLMPMESLAQGQDPRTKSQADTLFEEGKRALKLGDWAHACASFLRSESLDPSPSTLVKIARCHEHDKNPKAAYDSYQEALRLLGARAKADPQRRDLERLIVDAQAALCAELGQWRLRLAKHLEQFELELDGHALGPEALGATTVVAPGSHHIVVRATGYRILNLDIIALAGETRDVLLVLEAESTPSDPIVAKPSHDIHRGQMPQSRVALPATYVPRTTPVRPNALPAATNSNNGLPPFAPRENAANASARERDTSPNRRQRVAAVATGSLGGMLLGMSGYLGFRTRSLVNQAQSDNHCTQDWSCDSVGMSRIAEAERVQTQAIVLAAGGFALLGAGVVLWVTAPSPPRVTAAKGTVLNLRLTPAGATIVGHW